MKIRPSISTYFTIYFLLLLWLYHAEIKYYFYWEYIAELKDGEFNFSFLRLVLAGLIFGLNVRFLTRIDHRKLGFIILSLFFILLTIPSLIAFISEGMYPSQLLLYHQLFFFVSWFMLKLKFSITSIPVLNKKQGLLVLLLITVIGTIPYLLVYGPHINLKNLLLLDVYKTRSSMAGLSNVYFGYTYSLFTKIIIPLIIVFSLELRNKLLAFVGVLYLVLFYLFGAHKTVYLGLIVVLIFYRWTYLKSVSRILLYSSLFIIICLMLAVAGYDYPWILTFRRVHFLPTLLDITYLDFFKDNYMYWSESVLGAFVDYPYQIRHEYIIGETYFNRPDMAANNGIISDGYMNFGALGVLVNIGLVSSYFMILNNLKIPSRYFGLFLLVIFSFISSSIFTVFLTHGALALLLISIFLIREKND
ncbi:hypothetical protein PP178_03525 [Zeaxanthinibacter sp. PT1]|uniref:hypothetical protein n=1 Tax=Zeaxanthinibacter TaxID=561554 RepID=UPI00234BAEF2|nr:hypothetical protein [Zeaxanthinibacter sp. PT1]MDC6350610.1 hypothetical protein [Zeaxanthinibacter sp. PT1]